MEEHKLLPGYRFCPMEDELLLEYLKPKVEGKEVPGKDSLIREWDLYGNEEPWKVWERFEARHGNDLRKNKDLYFFTRKKKVSAKASRTCRKVGNGGTWKGQTKAKEVSLVDQDQKETTTVLGYKKIYTYQNKRSEHDGCWIMYEFELDSSQLLPETQVNKNDYVLCLLRKNNELPEKKRKREQEEEEDYVEDEEAESNVNTDPGLVVEELQEKRQRLLPCSNKNAAAPLLFGWAELEQWYDQAPPLVGEQEVRPAPLEGDPAVALQGYKDLRVQPLATEPQQGQESLRQQCQDDVPATFAANDNNLGQQKGDALVGVMTQGNVDSANLRDVMVGQDRSMEDVLNDEQLIDSMEVEDCSDGLLDYSNLTY